MVISHQSYVLTPLPFHLQATETDMAHRAREWHRAFSPAADIAALFRKHPQLLLSDAVTARKRLLALEDGLREPLVGAGEGEQEEEEATLPLLDHAVPNVHA